MEKVLVHLTNSILTLSFEMMEGDVDVDDLTKIHYENLFGELVTVSALLNKIGLIKAEAEEIHSLKKLELEIYKAETNKRLRREIVENGGKIRIVEKSQGTIVSDVLIKGTEDAIENAIILDEGYQIKKKNEIKAFKDFSYIDSLYWAIQSKDKKLNNLMREVTPEDFEKEIVEGVINGILIKRHKYKNIK